jgi:hypothetical protein
MDFRSGQAVGALLGFNDHAVSHLWRTLRAAKVPHLILRLIRDAHRHHLALGGFDLDVSRVDGGHDAAHVLTTAMRGHQAGAQIEKERAYEERRNVTGRSFRWSINGGARR